MQFKCSFCGRIGNRRRSAIANNPSPCCSKRCWSHLAFMRHIRKGQTQNACWIWTGGLSKSGYGKAGDGKGNGMRAHRRAWEVFMGPIPPGMCVCHNCPGGDNPSCVNPAHLWLGTSPENTADMKAKGRHCFGAKNGSAKLTEDEARDVKRIYGHLNNGEKARYAGELGVCRSTCAAIVAGRTWSHI